MGFLGVKIKSKPKPNLQACKDGSKRKGKATHTAERMRWSIYFWRKLRRRLKHHLDREPKGEATRIAQAIGTSDAQIHRWHSPCKCDHQQEPSFSIGMALLLYLESYLLRAPTITYSNIHPAVTLTPINRRKRKPSA